MKKKEIKKGNIAIALFLGYTKGTYDHGINGKREIWCNDSIEIGHYKSIEEFSFHHSWNSLMPILNKIDTIRKDLYEDYYNDTQKEITECFYNNASICKILMDLEELPLIGTSIEVAYNLAVLFIQWYNIATKRINGKH